MFCQFCGTTNSDGREVCTHCGNKLLVVSGGIPEEEQDPEELYFQAQEQLEEHLLERISGLEETVRRMAEAINATAERVSRLEHELTVAHAGVNTLGSLLETQGVLSRTEVVDSWERCVGELKLSRDLAERFAERVGPILSQAEYKGHDSAEFRRSVHALQQALIGKNSDQTPELLVELSHMAPNNDELWSFLGEAAFETGNLELAKTAFARVLELRGGHYETLIYLGTVLTDLEQWNEAEQVLQLTLQMAPDAFLPRFALGATAALRGHHREALGHLLACLEIEENSHALYLAGVCHLHMAHPGKAITVLRRAIELEPAFEEAIYQLGLAYLRRGWSKLALAAFRQVLSLDPHRLHYQETVRVLSVPAKDLNAEATSLVENAEIALEHDRPEVALSLYAAAAEAAPEQSALHATTALLASALGRARLAVGHAHRLLRGSPEDSPYLAAAVVALLESLRQAGWPRTARRFAYQLFRESRSALARAMAAYELALVESELDGDLEGARGLARDALEITPKELRHYPLAALGTIAIKRGRYREAVQYLEKATETAPQPLLLRELAVARLGIGDSEGAEAALETAHRQPTGGLDEEMLGHFRRLGSLVQQLSSRQRGDRNSSQGG